MWRLVVISVLFSVCVAHVLDGTFLYRSAKTCDELHELEKRCSDDCKSVELCYANLTSRYSYSWITYLQCTGDQICNEDDNGKVKCGEKDEDGACSIKSGKASCNEDGIYPHPQDCTKFIDCEKGKIDNDIYACPNGYMFSACTKNCDWNFDEKECDNTQIKCTDIGKKNAVYSNNRIYYECDYENKTFYPIFYNCKSGQIFTGDKCENHPLPGCGIQ